MLKYPTTWFLAQKACTARGARLAQPDNSLKNDFIAEKLKSVGQTTCWFGASKHPDGNPNKTADQFTYTDGSLVNFTNWDKGRGK